MGKRLYCIITGEGDNVNWKINGLQNSINEQKAWETAFQKRGIVVNQNKNKKNSQNRKKKEENPWQQIYNKWNSGDWGQINSRVGLKDCIIWIKKKDKFKIREKVKETYAQNIVNEIQKKLNTGSFKDIDEIVILVHGEIDKNVKNTYLINTIPVKWITYTTAYGISKNQPIWLVKLIIEAIYSCDITNLCDKLSNALPEVEKKIEASEQGKSLSLLKHQIVNILEPLRIDIDGLMEKNFDDEYWKKVSNYWRKKNLEGIFEDINDIIKKSLKQKVLGQDVKSFVDLLSKKIAELKKWYKVAKLLTALETGDKKAVQNICKLYGNVYKIWMDELINEFEKVKSNL